MFSETYSRSPPSIITNSLRPPTRSFFGIPLPSPKIPYDGPNSTKIILFLPISSIRSAIVTKPPAENVTTTVQLSLSFPVDLPHQRPSQAISHPQVDSASVTSQQLEFVAFSLSAFLELAR